MCDTGLAVRQSCAPARPPVLAHAVLFAEFVYTPARIDNLLFARVKRVARGANFNKEILAERRTRFKFVAATTGDFDPVVIGVNIGFHLLRFKVL